MKKLQSADGHVCCRDNVFKFENNVNATEFNPEIFEFQIDQQNCVATVLQIVFLEVVKKQPSTSPVATKKVRGCVKHHESAPPAAGGDVGNGNGGGGASAAAAGTATGSATGGGVAAGSVTDLCS